MCIPGLYDYKVKLKDVPEEEIEKGCPICLFRLDESPTGAEHETEINGKIWNFDFLDGGRLTDQTKKFIAKKPKYVYKTPCNHYFHEGCLKHWIHMKSDCPVCRRKLPDYY